jgi:uncharacterized membrane protein YphA (DoxX/SURF4 family)
MYAINNICRLLLGALFIFSGFVKSIDPLGTSYKLFDYFKAGGAAIPDNIALILAVSLCAAELFIGLALLLNLKVKLVSWLSIAFMVFFTIITLVLALTNKVADCGCFGDAFKLTNWQTFYKNLVILPFAILVFWQRNKFKEEVAQPISWIAFVLILGASVYVNIYSLRHLPLINYRPYQIGQNILAGMKTPPNAPADVYDIKLVYQKNGVKKEFTEQTYPWQDTTWVFVEQKTTLVKKGFITPIHDFSILSPDKGDITEKVLKKRGTTYLFIAPNLAKANIENAKKANEIYSICQSRNIPFICLSSSTGEQVNKFRAQTGALYPIYATDETTLKTTMRSNPGLMMLQDGTIAGIWSGYDIPDPVFFKGNSFGKQLMAIEHEKTQRTASLLAGLVLLFGLLLLLLRRE